MNIPKNLVSSIQYEFVKRNHENGIFIFRSIKEETIKCVLEGLIQWADKKGYITESFLNLSSLHSTDSTK